ncbi:hypothetical protein [Enemella sp. A6]|uniref:hypothetical protein n=1 Tax=Enemella sp. A6 TaxID=3440152 RepID=UPI003EC0E5C4
MTAPDARSEELPESARELLRTTLERPAPAPVDAYSIMAWASGVRDGGASYWTSAPGERRAPAVMATTWLAGPRWSPHEQQGSGLSLHHDLKAALGYPFAVVRSIDNRYGAPVHEGDLLTSRYAIKRVSPERPMRRGPGRTWDIGVEIRNQRDEIVAVTTWGFSAYRLDESAAGAESKAEAKPAAQPEQIDGEPLPSLEVPIDTSTVILSALASRDVTAFHHDPAAARASGMEDIIVNTPARLGFLSRWLVTDTWPDARLCQLRLNLNRSIHPGEHLTLSGRQTATEQLNDSVHRRDVRFTESTTHPVGHGTATVLTGAGAWDIPWTDLIDTDER